jgi:hypothetical protein
MFKKFPAFEQVMATGMIILGAVLVIGASWLPELQINNFNKELLSVYFGVLFIAHGAILIKMRADERRLNELQEVVEKEIEKQKKLRN